MASTAVIAARRVITILEDRAAALIYVAAELDDAARPDAYAAARAEAARFAAAHDAAVDRLVDAELDDLLAR